jgi:hypothetical protein
MKNWNLLFRRTHLYLGMLLLPWLAMYALSTVVFNHPAWFNVRAPADSPWLPAWERPCTIPVAPGTDGLRDAAGRVLAENGIRGAFAVQRQGERLMIRVQNFWHPTRVTYDLEARTVRAEQKHNTSVEVLLRLHERTGYRQGGTLDNLWALIVDTFCVGMLAWIGTGLYLWWKLPATRGWGFVAIAGGLATIAALLATV